MTTRHCRKSSIPLIRPLLPPQTPKPALQPLSKLIPRRVTAAKISVGGVSVVPTLSTHQGVRRSRVLLTGGVTDAALAHKGSVALTRRAPAVVVRAGLHLVHLAAAAAAARGCLAHPGVPSEPGLLLLTVALDGKRRLAFTFQVLIAVALLIIIKLLVSPWHQTGAVGVSASGRAGGIGVGGVVNCLLRTEGAGGGGGTYNALVALIGAAGCVNLAHQVRALPVLHPVPGHVGHARGDDGRALEGHMLDERVLDVFAGRRLDCLLVAVLHCVEGRVELLPVAVRHGGVVWSLVVVRHIDDARLIEGVDDIGRLLVARVVEVGSSHGDALLLLDGVEWAVGHVAGISGAEGARPTQALALV